MSYMFKPAVREKVGMIVGLIGSTSSGKTYSAMRLAAGMAGDKRFALIDTENRRALMYADKFNFDYVELEEPFRPDAYADAIAAAKKAGYEVIVVDSMSHEWSGVGGILEWQEEELDRMAGKDYGKREACKMAAWIKPKQSHKQMVSRLLQLNAHIILCFRAEEKIEMKKVNGKTEIINTGFQPITEKNMAYELAIKFYMTADNPGVPAQAQLREQFKPMFPPGTLIDENMGKALAEWARGGKKQEPKPEAAKPAEPAKEVSELDAKRNAVTLEAKRIGPAAFEECKMGCFIGTLKAASLDELQVLLEACREKPDQQ